jgi:hypothetical protein
MIRRNQSMATSSTGCYDGTPLYTFLLFFPSPALMPAFNPKNTDGSVMIRKLSVTNRSGTKGIFAQKLAASPDLPLGINDCITNFASRA